MLKRAMVVVLLGCVGLTAGLAFGTVFSSNEFSVTFAVPAHTVSAADLVSVERGHHPGVHLVARGQRVIELWTTHHPIDVYEDWSSLCMATLSPHASLGGPACAIPVHPSDPRRPLRDFVLLGLLAGLSAAAGFLMPPRSRVTSIGSNGATVW